MPSTDCYLAVRGYNAVPVETVSGGISSDRTDEFRKATEENLPVVSISREPHKFAPELFGEVIVAELDTDRIQLNRYMGFLEDYASRVGVEQDLRYVSVGIDPRVPTAEEFSDVDMTTAPVVEVQFDSKSKVKEIVRQWRKEIPWVVGYNTSQSTAVIRHRGGQNDLVSTQVLEFIDKIEESHIRKIALTCGVSALASSSE